MYKFIKNFLLIIIIFHLVSCSLESTTEINSSNKKGDKVSNFTIGTSTKTGVTIKE